jgi:hypothetical protein
MTAPEGNFRRTPHREKTMNREVEEYVALPYPMHIEQRGGDYVASYQLLNLECAAPTAPEAVALLQHHKRPHIENLLRNRKPILKPFGHEAAKTQFEQVVMTLKNDVLHAAASRDIEDFERGDGTIIELVQGIIDAARGIKVAKKKKKSKERTKRLATVNSI